MGSSIVRKRRQPIRPQSLSAIPHERKSTRSRTDRRRALGEKIPWTAGRVVGVGDSSGGRTGGAGGTIVRRLQGSLFLWAQMVFGKATVTADMPLVAGSVLAFSILTRVPLAAARRADAALAGSALAGSILTGASLAGTVLTRAVLAGTTAAMISGLMGIGTVEVGEEQPVND